MGDALELTGGREGFAIRDCLPKLRFFCQHDAYADCDHTGYRHASEPDQFHPDLLTATNRAMRARASRKAWADFFGRSLPELARVPLDVDLIEASDDAYASARTALEGCYRLLTGHTWITDMSASKMLYLKRPRLVAISDSYIRQILSVTEPDPRQHPWRVEYCTTRALRVSDAVRYVGLRNRELLDHLQACMAGAVGEIAARCAVPMSLSKARILDILLWVDAAIAAGHRMWKPEADAAGWRSVARDIASAAS